MVVSRRKGTSGLFHQSGRFFHHRLLPLRIYILFCSVVVNSVSLQGIPTVSAYEVDPHTTGATVHGRVVYTGDLPVHHEIKVGRDRHFCGDTMPDESMQIDEASRGVALALVTIEGIEKGKALPESRALELENKSCRFFPRISTIIQNTQLIIMNSDPVMHNSHVRKGNRFGENFLNIVQPPTTRAEKTFKETGLYDVRCDAHPFMHAAIHVFDHPYFALTDANGNFELSHVPPGKYRIRLWHEKFKKQERFITVPADGSLMINFEVEQSS